MFEFSEIDKETIRKTTLDVMDEKDKENLDAVVYATEITASIFLIQNILGIDWFKRAIALTRFNKI